MTKLGIIGAGTWATPYAHAAKNAGAEITGIYTPDNSAADLAAKVNAHAASSADDVISSADCIILGSPTYTHADYIEKLATSQKPTLIASPIAATESDLDTIEKAAASAPNLYASLPHRARPEFKRLKAAITSGELGQLGIVRLGKCLPKQQGWRADSAKSGGALIQTGIHLLDALTWLAGPITRIYGSTPDSDLQYHVLVARLHDGTIAHLEISWAEADNAEYDYYEVAGSNGLLDYDTRTAPLMRLEAHTAPAAETLRPGATIAEHELRDFLNTANTGNKGDFATVTESAALCRKLLQIQQAIKANSVLTLA